MKWFPSLVTTRSRMQRAVLTFVSLFAVLVLFAPVAPAMAADDVSFPNVKDFQSARYDLLAKLTVGDESGFLYYGQGAVILPDRATVTLNTADNKTISVIIIGTAIYTNDGSGWQRADNGSPTDVASPVSANQQLAAIQEIANSVVLIGEEDVRGMKTDHYQVLISGDKFSDTFAGTDMSQAAKDLLAQSTLKYDLWISEDDGFIHQINTSLNIPETIIDDQDVPATEVATLITYYSFNDDGISIEAPN